jgi:hypothetical protein
MIQQEEYLDGQVYRDSTDLLQPTLVSVDAGVKRQLILQRISTIW